MAVDGLGTLLCALTIILINSNPLFLIIKSPSATREIPCHPDASSQFPTIEGTTDVEAQRRYTCPTNLKFSHWRFALG